MSLFLPKRYGMLLISSLSLVLPMLSLLSVDASAAVVTRDISITNRCPLVVNGPGGNPVPLTPKLKKGTTINIDASLQEKGKIAQYGEQLEVYDTRKGYTLTVAPGKRKTSSTTVAFDDDVFLACIKEDHGNSQPPNPHGTVTVNY